MTPRHADFPIGFLAAGTSRRVVDVPKCPIATDANQCGLRPLP
ncbi:hypothetical protein EMGBD4_01250 [Verrucomicrobiota bacterium]|nr:hypothetical protein EMGBD4_01250 [Verrucomicrobiota bacterium]